MRQGRSAGEPLMLWRTHAGTGVLFGLAVDGAALAVGAPLEPLQAVALPVLTGYLAAVPDVDHHSSKIRYVVPPARWLFVLLRLVTRVMNGPDAADRWFGHRRITHSVAFAVLLGAAGTAVALFYGLWWWLGAAAAVGCLAHVAGDCFTVGGCPVWAPFSWRRFSLGLCRTGGRSEGVFAVAQGGVAGVLMWLMATAGG